MSCLFFLILLALFLSLPLSDLTKATACRFLYAEEMMHVGFLGCRCHSLLILYVRPTYARPVVTYSVCWHANECTLSVFSFLRLVVIWKTGSAFVYCCVLGQNKVVQLLPALPQSKRQPLPNVINSVLFYCRCKCEVIFLSACIQSSTTLILCCVSIPTNEPIPSVRAERHMSMLSIHRLPSHCPHEQQRQLSAPFHPPIGQGWNLLGTDGHDVSSSPWLWRVCHPKGQPGGCAAVWEDQSSSWLSFCRRWREQSQVWCKDLGGCILNCRVMCSECKACRRHSSLYVCGYFVKMRLMHFSIGLKMLL